MLRRAVCESAHTNDNSVYVKCAAFGPLGHISPHAWPCHHLLLLYCVPFVCLVLIQGAGRGVGGAGGGVEGGV